MKYEQLSEEQKRFIQIAQAGHNILVDACIGSGKTTAIQTLCDTMPGKRILYLTYNKLLKLDAKKRITNRNVNVTNYHGFCWMELNRIGIQAGITDLIQVYNKKQPPCGPYDVLILDEYQDIEQEIAEMLTHIKHCRPTIQIIAVGDMQQKIYDKTRLQVQDFIEEFLETYQPIEFTKCFRIGKAHAAMLGRIWNKQIVGVNDKFQILTMDEEEAKEFASGLKPSQLLVLGRNAGKRTKLQNYLESHYEETFNKRTVWSKIVDSDGLGGTSPTPDCAIFTTYDGCKGMERDVCILYDWSWMYWNARLSKPNNKYEIIRNIFCVAASRAKSKLIIVQTDDPLTEDDILEGECYEQDYSNMPISSMFDFKFIEDIEAAYRCLDIRTIHSEGNLINVPTQDNLIDLSSCIGIYQEAMYFKNYNIAESIEYYLQHPDRGHMRRAYQKYSLDQKILYLTALETLQWRYCGQVKWPIVSEDAKEKIAARLATHLTPEETEQIPCKLPFYENGRLLFCADGIMDVVKDNMVYELKFVSVLSHVHVLQTAMYLAATGYAVGRLWNVRTDEMLEIRIPDRKKFLDLVATAVTKGHLMEYNGDDAETCKTFIDIHRKTCKTVIAAFQSDTTKTVEDLNAMFFECGLQLPVDPVTFAGCFMRIDKRQKANIRENASYEKRTSPITEHERKRGVNHANNGKRSCQLVPHGT